MAVELESVLLRLLGSRITEMLTSNRAAHDKIVFSPPQLLAARRDRFCLRDSNADHAVRGTGADARLRADAAAGLSARPGDLFAGLFDRAASRRRGRCAA